MLLSLKTAVIGLKERTKRRLIVKKELDRAETTRAKSWKKLKKKTSKLNPTAEKAKSSIKIDSSKAELPSDGSVGPSKHTRFKPTLRSNRSLKD